MDFANPKKLKILTKICILFRVLKHLEEEGGGGYKSLQTLWHA